MIKPRFRLAVSAAVLLAGLVLFSGCQGDREAGEQEAGAGEAEVAQRPVPGGTAVIAFAAEPDVLNSLIRVSSYTGQILAMLQDSAMYLGEDMQWHPRIAATYELAPDSLALTFQLQPWVWSDGEPLTAFDFAESFRLLKLPEVASPHRGFFNSVIRAVPLDSATVRYEFVKALPDPLARTHHTLLPAHVTAALSPARIHSWSLNEKPLSSGPFILAKWEHNFELVLVPNEQYPGPRPPLDRVIFRIIPDETSRVLALETGGVDVMEELPIQAARRLSGGDAVHIYRISGRLFGYLSFNFRNPLFQDSRVRKAISLAIDRGSFVDGLLGGYGTPAASLLPPGLWAHNSDVAPDPYDPKRARSLLTEAGWVDGDGDGIREKDGREFAFELLTRHGDPVRENGVVVIRENLRQVGIVVKPRILEFTTAIQMTRKGKFDTYLGVGQANLYIDPTPWLHSSATDRFNKGHYNNAVVDSLLELATSLRDRGRAKPVWDRLQEVVAEELPMVFIYYPETLVGVSTRLRNVRPHMLSPYNNIDEWWIAPADRKYTSPRE